MNYQFQFDAVFAAWPLLLKGTWITVQLSLTATLLGLVAESAAPWRAVLRALPGNVPYAIEYPLVGDDLEAVTREEVARIRAVKE